MKQKLAVFILAAAALAATSCGSKSDSSKATTTPKSETAAASATVTATSNDSSGTAMATATATATASETAAASAGGDKPTIVIGAQDFGESAILSEVYGQALSGAGYDVKQQSLGGYRDIEFTAFKSGDINFAAEYAASALDFLKPDTATGDITETADNLRTALKADNLVALDPAPAVDSNSFVVTPETAATLKAKTVSSLTDGMTLGGPADCPDNASCLPGLKSVYGIDLSANFTPLDGGGPLTVTALQEGQIDVAILFSTDGSIADKGWVVLEDDKHLINADNIIPVMSSTLTDAYGDDFEALVNKVSAALTTQDLTEMNRQFSVDKLDAKDVAAKWLADKGLAAG